MASLTRTRTATSCNVTTLLQAAAVQAAPLYKLQRHHGAAKNMFNPSALPSSLHCTSTRRLNRAQGLHHGTQDLTAAMNGTTPHADCRNLSPLAPCSPPPHGHDSTPSLQAAATLDLPPSTHRPDGGAPC
ncbi:unnamed protein product [Urochloa humidicola]